MDSYIYTLEHGPLYMDLKKLSQVVSYLVMGERTPYLATAMNAFNQVRINMASVSRETLKHNEGLISKLRKAESVRQVSAVPDHSLCAVSGEALTNGNGLLLIMEVDKKQVAVCIHTRFVDAAYQMFLASHFDQHIIKVFEKWCKTQIWYVPGQKYPGALKKFLEYNRKSNLKSLLIQLNE